MSTAGNAVALTTTPVALHTPTTDTPGKQWESYYVSNRSTSSNNVLVNISGLHASGDFVGLEPGTALVFKDATGLGGIVTAKTDAGAATVDHGIISSI